MTTRIKALIYKSSASILRLAPLSALVLTNVCFSHAVAQDNHAHAPTPQQYKAADPQGYAGPLIQIVPEPA